MSVDSTVLLKKILSAKIPGLCKTAAPKKTSYVQPISLIKPSISHKRIFCTSKSLCAWWRGKESILQRYSHGYQPPSTTCHICPHKPADKRKSVFRQILDFAMEHLQSCITGKKHYQLSLYDWSEQTKSHQDQFLTAMNSGAHSLFKTPLVKPYSTQGPTMEIEPRT